MLFIKFSSILIKIVKIVFRLKIDIFRSHFNTLRLKVLSYSPFSFHQFKDILYKCIYMLNTNFMKIVVKVPHPVKVEVPVEVPVPVHVDRPVKVPVEVPVEKHIPVHRK